MELALSAADAMIGAYRVDPPATKMAALAAVPLGDRKAAGAAAVAYLAVSDQALAAGEDLDTAAKAAAQAQTAARKAGDKAAAARATAQAKAVAAAKKDRAAADAAEKALAENPDDPKANLTLGRYLCFVRGEWEQGLPRLAEGSDPALKALAAKEVAGPEDPAAMAEVADAWWALPGGRGGVSPAQARWRAAHWYAKALPGLSGLKRAAAEKRVAEAGAGADPAGVVVDLLALVDPKGDALHGTWERAADGLASDAGHPSRLRIPYVPPAEYDFHIEFTRRAGAGNVVQILSRGGTELACHVGVDNVICGFETVGGRGVLDNATTVRIPGVLKTGARHRCVVRVRARSVSAYLDGKLLVRHDTDYSDLSRPGMWAVGERRIGVGSQNSPTLFHRMEVVEVTGTGKVGRQSP